MNTIRHALNAQDWRQAATIGGITAALGGVWCMAMLPGTLCPELGAVAVAGALVAMVTEARA